MLKGDRVQIINTRFDSHRDRIGKQGTITRYVKCRNAYYIDLDCGEKWESVPENIKLITARS